MKWMGIEAKVRQRIVDEKGLVLVDRSGRRAVVFGKEPSKVDSEESQGKQKRQGLSAEWSVLVGWVSSTAKLTWSLIGRLCVATCRESCTMKLPA